MSTKIHLIGICGTAMATLAAMLKRKGVDVRGSDQDVYPPMSDFLASEQIPAFTGYTPDHITGDLDLVVVGNAISRGNAELEEVLDRKIRYCSLPEAIREHFLWGSRSIVIAGTHGKTTTTALAGWVLTDAGADPSVLVGGIARNFSYGRLIVVLDAAADSIRQQFRRQRAGKILFVADERRAQAADAFETRTVRQRG